jgi:hypothetical protein
MRELRQEVTYLLWDLLWGLDDRDWQATGEHPYRGAVSIETLARELAQHDLEHLAEVRKVKAEIGVA